MKLTESNWRDFLAYLPQYEDLTPRERDVLLSAGDDTYPAKELQNEYWRLVSAGFLHYGDSHNRMTVPVERQGFLRVLRVLQSHPLFDAPTFPAFAAYVDEHLTAGERQALVGENAELGERTAVLYRKLSSAAWVGSFLAAESPDWEKSYLTPDLPSLLSQNGVFETAQNLVARVAELGGRASLRELALLWSDDELLASALRASTRYGLLFAALDHQTLDPVLGVWPAAAPELAGMERSSLEPTSPDETFDAAFLMDDITTLLVACATRPVAIRAANRSMLAKTHRDLATSLHPLPRWVDRFFDYDAEMRLTVAQSYVYSFEFATVQAAPSPQLTITDRGRRWLALDAGQRLRVLVDGVHNALQMVPGFDDYEGAQIGALAPLVHFETAAPLPDVERAVYKVYRALKGNDFYPLSRVLSQSSPKDNPFLPVLRQDSNLRLYVDNEWVKPVDAAHLQKAWVKLLKGFLRVRLFPLGGVRLGKGPGGVSIAISPPGRYYIGQTEKWKWSPPAAAQVIVQPNFEVTFLGAAPSAEAEIGRFAERRGQRMGALFQITKKSIFAAAAAGMKVAEALDILDRVCTRAVPANVRREIEGWFAQCRSVSFEPTMLIRCPDPQTAARVIGLGKGTVVALNDTVLEYSDPGGRVAFIKKLKEAGVSVDAKPAIPVKTAVNRRPPATRGWSW